MALSGDNLVTTDVGEGTVGIWWVESGMLVNILQHTGRASAAQIDTVQNISSAKIEEPYVEVWFDSVRLYPFNFLFSR